jgi:hypothetical protein
MLVDADETGDDGLDSLRIACNDMVAEFCEGYVALKVVDYSADEDCWSVVQERLGFHLCNQKLATTAGPVECTSDLLTLSPMRTSILKGGCCATPTAVRSQNCVGGAGGENGLATRQFG